MDTIIDFVIGTAISPLELAVRFLLFVLFMDSIFSVINALLGNLRR